jgi:flagellar protein FlbD
MVTRLNGKAFYVNDELIEFIEETPDTVISLVTDKKIIVTESIDEVVRRIVEYRQKACVLPIPSHIYKGEV